MRLFVLGAIGASGILSIPSPAQSTFGSILGTVRDPSGSVVPGATVTATNKGTAARRTATTDSSAAIQS